MSEKEKDDPVLNDLSEKRGYNKMYIDSLRTLITHLNWLLEYETNKKLRKDYELLRNSVNKRYTKICHLLR